jgi:hypothetical protein
VSTWKRKDGCTCMLMDAGFIYYHQQVFKCVSLYAAVEF